MNNELWQRVMKDFPLSLRSLHGPSHWVRVERNGLFLAELLQVDEKLVSCFALFHDCRRRNDDTDDGHGQRGADYIDTVGEHLTDLAPEELKLLKKACACHTDHKTTSIPLLAVCWDADRLDLGRVGISPDPAYLNTAPARRLIEQGQLAHLQTLPCRQLDQDLLP